MIYELLLFAFGILIGVVIDGIYHFKIHLPKETEDKTEQMEEELKERERTLELLDDAIKQKKNEKYELVKQNIRLRKMNEELVELQDTAEKLKKRTMEQDDDIKLYVLSKDKEQMSDNS